MNSLVSSMVTLQLQQLNLPVGQRILIEALSWEDFNAILSELGERLALPTTTVLSKLEGQLQSTTLTRN